ncbi:MAG: hypothetical protein ABI894_14195 [Ilumatobacteraceae bacterium]
MFATIAVVVVNRLGNDVASGDALHDVDPNEALPLGQAAPITPNVLSARWRQVDDFSTADYAQVSTATYSALPKCAKFTTFGMLPPTTKSVTIHHDFASDSSLLFHDVIVFATHEDATKAMDAISGGNFAECWFDVFDRLTPLGRYLGATSESVDLEAPQIQLHGERQFIIGQHIRYSFPNGPQERDFINAYVQVGRAITFVNPELSTGPNSLANVENVIAASADALEAEFGR